MSRLRGSTRCGLSHNVHDVFKQRIYASHDVCCGALLVSRFISNMRVNRFRAMRRATPMMNLREMTKNPSHIELDQMTSTKIQTCGRLIESLRSAW
jgi:hypothetical protein